MERKDSLSRSALLCQLMVERITHMKRHIINKESDICNDTTTERPPSRTAEQCHCHIIQGVCAMNIVDKDAINYQVSVHTHK